MGECTPVCTLMEKLSAQWPGTAPDFPDLSVDGAQQYVASSIRFDIVFSVSFLSRRLDNPTDEDVVRAKRAIRYLADTCDMKLVYSFNVKTRSLQCYSDADFAGYPATMRSTCGVVVKFAGAAISWLSRPQELVADSTCEREIVTANLGSKEIIWISRLFMKFSGLTMNQQGNSLQILNFIFTRGSTCLFMIGSRMKCCQWNILGSSIDKSARTS